MSTKPSILLLLLVALIASSGPGGFATGDAWGGLSGSRAGQTVDGIGKLKSYLRGLGYIDRAQPADLSDVYDDSLVSAVTLYQRNFHLQVTGTVTDETLRHIMTPRCGVADIVDGTNTMAMPYGGSVAHYSFFPGRWPKNKTLTYAFLPQNKDKIDYKYKIVFGSPFSHWTVDAAMFLQFMETEAYDEADIKIGFYTDDPSFNSPGGEVIVHAFPPTDGRLSLDDKQNWVLEGDVAKAEGPNPMHLESVLMHAIGHLIGLDHSTDVSAVMYPLMEPRTRKVALAADDVIGAQVLYGKNPIYDHIAVDIMGLDSGGNSSGRSGGYSRSGAVRLLLQWWWTLLSVASVAYFVLF